MVYERKKILPYVAIVIPTYNAGEGFVELLRELSCQTQPEFDDTDMLYQAYEYYQQEKVGKKV